MQGFEYLRCLIAASVADKMAGERKFENSKLNPSEIYISVSPRSREGLLFLAEWFPSWNRRCPIVGNFGPKCSWQAVGHCDASTDWGWGGWVMERGSSPPTATLDEWSDVDREKAFVVSRPSTGVLKCWGAARWCSAFGPSLAGKRVELRMDNSAAVQAIASRYSRLPAMMEPIREIRFICTTLEHPLSCLLCFGRSLQHDC